MGKQRTAPPPNDNLTISRIHIVLRPFETKLNVLARTLERKIAEDKYAPKPRQPGITYAKRHRIRAMTGMTSQQAGRAYALEKSKGLSTLYSFHEQLIGVEDAFRNLLRGIPPLEVKERAERVPSLQAMVSQMIGRQVAEETLREKDELEAEGVEDCIGLWYGGLSVHCRKYALVAHAVQLVELKIPFFILELWKGLLTITMQAGLREESCTLLEYILLYYFTPDDTTVNNGACPAAHMAGRDLTDLYTQLTDLSVHPLPPADFFATLLPVIEASPGAAAIWSFRCIHHLIRNFDDDLILTARIVDSMARTWSELKIHSLGRTEDMKKLVNLIESKTYGFLTVITALSNPRCDTEVISEELVHEVGHLAWTTNLVGSCQPSADLLGISLALDVVIILLATEHSRLAGLNLSDPIERLNTIGSSQQDGEESDEEIYKSLIKGLYSARPAPLFAHQNEGAETSSLVSSASSPTATGRPELPSHLAECFNALRVHGLEDLADRLEGCYCEMISSGEDMRLCVVPTPSGGMKRSRMGKGSRGGKRRKLQTGWKDGESGGDGETSYSESDVATEWSASVSGEDTAGEQEEEEQSEDEDEEDADDDYTAVEISRKPSGRGEEDEDEEDDRTVIPETQSMDNEDGEELEDDSDTFERQSSHPNSTPRQLQPSNRQTYKFGSALHHRPHPHSQIPGPSQTRLNNIRNANSAASTSSRHLNASSQLAPVLRTVVSSKMASAMVARLARRTREEERQREKETMTSSDDDLDLLGAVEREKAALAARYGRAASQRRRESSARESERWSTP